MTRTVNRFPRGQFSNNLAEKVALRYASRIDSEWVSRVLGKLDQGNAPSAYLRLQQLARTLQSGALELDQSELADWLESWDVPSDEIQVVLGVKIPSPKVLKQVSFSDAFLKFGRATGVSVVPDMRLELDPQAGKAVLGWLAGWSKLKPTAKKVWGKWVKKVHFGRPSGSEDASWRSGGTLYLDGTRQASPATRTTQITHELGHAVEEQAGHQGQPFGLPPFCSDYAASKPYIEDFAESFRMFVEEPALLRRMCPEKWQALRDLAP